MPCDEPVMNARLPVRSNSSNAIWRPHADVERENSPPERLLHSAQPEAQEGVGMGNRTPFFSLSFKISTSALND
jgi:hypothetical protein